ncbi:MAG: nucleotidyltransferase domain-containing protein [Gemmatimonadales bacterium]
MHQAVERVVDSFLAMADGALPPGYSAVLYGSAARGDYVPGWSDINLLVVSESLTPDVLRKVGRGFAEWRTATTDAPLLISRAEWARATDVFPLEITDMRHAHTVLRGPDPISALRVAPPDLRSAVERELRGKLLRLRQGYAVRSSDEAALGDLAGKSASTVLVILRGLLTLLDRPVPSDSLQVAMAAAAMIGIEGEELLAVIRHRGQPGWRCSTAEFEAYLDAVTRAAGFVDQLKIGDER